MVLCPCDSEDFAQCGPAGLCDGLWVRDLGQLLSTGCFAVLGCFFLTYRVRTAAEWSCCGEPQIQTAKKVKGCCSRFYADVTREVEVPWWWGPCGCRALFRCLLQCLFLCGVLRHCLGCGPSESSLLSDSPASSDSPTEPGSSASRDHPEERSGGGEHSSWGPIQTGCNAGNLRTTSESLRELRLRMLEGGDDMRAARAQELQLRYFGASKTPANSTSRTTTFSSAEIADKFVELVRAANKRGARVGKSGSSDRAGSARRQQFPQKEESANSSTGRPRSSPAGKRGLVDAANPGIIGMRESRNRILSGLGSSGSLDQRLAALASRRGASSTRKLAQNAQRLAPAQRALKATAPVLTAAGVASLRVYGAARNGNGEESPGDEPGERSSRTAIDVDAVLQRAAARARAEGPIALKPIRPASQDSEDYSGKSTATPEYGYGLGPFDLELWPGTGLIWRVSVVLDAGKRVVIGLVNHDAGDAFLNLDGPSVKDFSKLVDVLFADFKVAESAALAQGTIDDVDTHVETLHLLKVLQLWDVDEGVRDAALVVVLLSELRRNASADLSEQRTSAASAQRGPQRQTGSASGAGAGAGGGGSRGAEFRRGGALSGLSVYYPKNAGLTCGQAVGVVLGVLLCAVGVVGLAASAARCRAGQPVPSGSDVSGPSDASGTSPPVSRSADAATAQHSRASNNLADDQAPVSQLRDSGGGVDSSGGSSGVAATGSTAGGEARGELNRASREAMWHAPRGRLPTLWESSEDSSERAQVQGMSGQGTLDAADPGASPRKKKKRSSLATTAVSSLNYSLFSGTSGFNSNAANSGYSTGAETSGTYSTLNYSLFSGTSGFNSNAANSGYSTGAETSATSATDSTLNYSLFSGASLGTRSNAANSAQSTETA